VTRVHASTTETKLGASIGSFASHFIHSPRVPSRTTDVRHPPACPTALAAYFRSFPRIPRLRPQRSRTLASRNVPRGIRFAPLRCRCTFRFNFTFFTVRIVSRNNTGGPAKVPGTNDRGTKRE